MSDLTNVPVISDISAPAATAAPSTVLGQAQATATSAVEQAHAAVAPQLNKAQEAAAPHVAHAQDIAAPYIAKAHEIIDPLVQKGTDLLAQAKASADKAIADKGYRADVKDKAVGATDDLTAQASQTTQATAADGQASLDSAKAYLSGVASTVTAKATELAHIVDDRTKTADHAGVFTLATNALSSATAYLPASITSHLPSSSSAPQPIGTAIHDTATSKADEQEIKEALAALAGKGSTSPNVINDGELIAKPLV